MADRWTRWPRLAGRPWTERSAVALVLGRRASCLAAGGTIAAGRRLRLDPATLSRNSEERQRDLCRMLEASRQRYAGRIEPISSSCRNSRWISMGKRCAPSLNFDSDADVCRGGLLILGSSPDQNRFGPRRMGGNPERGFHCSTNRKIPLLLAIVRKHSTRRAPMIYKGNCHCGKIALEVEGELGGAMACNCSICSRRARSCGSCRAADAFAHVRRRCWHLHSSQNLIKHHFCRNLRHPSVRGGRRSQGQADGGDQYPAVSKALT